MDHKEFQSVVGVGDFSAVEANLYGNLEDDEDLMAELLALEGEDDDGGGAPPKPTTRKPPPPKSVKPVVDKEKENDQDDDVDMDDPALLGELNDLLGGDDESSTATDPHVPSVSLDPELISTIKERLMDYEKAERRAKQTAETTKARRFSRGVATLKDLLRRAERGAAVAVDDLPVPIAVGSTPNLMDADIPADVETPIAKSELPAPLKPAAITAPPVVSSPTVAASPPIENSATIAAPPIGNSATVAAPPAGDSSTIDALVRRRNEYKAAAMSAKSTGDRVGALQFYKTAKQFDEAIEAVNSGQMVDLDSVPPPPTTKTQSTIVETPAAPVEDRLQANAAAAPAVTKPSSTLEALEQRLDKYKETIKKAKEEGNDRRARQSERIAKQYQDAIRATKAGRNFDYDELPTPPGCGPIPAAAPRRQQQPTATAATTNSLPSPTTTAAGVSGPTPPKQGKSDQQLEFLRHRRAQFQQAAVLAKKKGDVKLAMKFMVQLKGLDPLIQAAEGGARVDLASVPTPPQARTSAAALQPLLQETVAPTTTSTTTPAQIPGSRREVFATLEQDLIRQIRVGSVKSASDGRGLPKRFGCPEAGGENGRSNAEGEVSENSSSQEVSVVRALSVQLPDGFEERHADLHVKYELPLPDNNQQGKTASVKNTLSPEFQERFKLRINRKSRALQRFVKRHGVKFEIWQKGGFMRCPISVGACELKLIELEENSEIHLSLDLVQGRKSVGGKLEVKARIREPFVNKKADLKKEKWLVIDEFLTNRPAQQRQQQSNSRQQQQQQPRTRTTNQQPTKTNVRPNRSDGQLVLPKVPTKPPSPARQRQQPPQPAQKKLPREFVRPEF